MKYIVSIFIIALALTQVVATTVAGWSISLYVLLLATIIPFVLIFNFRSGFKYQVKGMPVIIGILFISTILNIGITRWSSLIYSFLFLGGFVLVSSYREKIDNRSIICLLKVIIVLYFVNVVIAQLLQAIGMQTDLLANVFRSQFDGRTGDYRYFGFSSEPSYAAFIVNTAFLVYLKLKQTASEKIELWVCALVFYQIIAFSSLYGYFLCSLIVLVEAYRKSRFWTLVSCSIFGFILFAFYAGSIFSDSTRIGRIASTLISGDITKLGLADSSVALRVLPVIEYINSLSLGDIRMWFGHGPAASTSYFSDLYFIHMNPESNLEILRFGFFPAFVYDFGIVGVVAIFWFIKRFIVKQMISFEFLFIILMLFNANFNTQLFWFVLTVFALLKYSTLKESPSIVLKRGKMIKSVPVYDTGVRG